VKYYRNDEAIKAFGVRVKKLRKQQHLTQKQLAFEVGISDIQIRRIERGEINTSLSVIVGISQTFSVSLKELFDY
jgi:transcriptional regulator with XRE-family HTH domain